MRSATTLLLLSSSLALASEPVAEPASLALDADDPRRLDPLDDAHASVFSSLRAGAQRKLFRCNKRCKRKCESNPDWWKCGGGGGRDDSNDSDGDNNSDPEPVSGGGGECAGSDPRRCGCPNVDLVDYRGSLSTTENGFRCREWSNPDAYPDAGLDDFGGAVCRNPAGVATRPWCFVDHAQAVWDYCNVPECSMEVGSRPRPPPPPPTPPPPSPSSARGCVDTNRYYQIDADIQDISDGMGNDKDRAHFLGGILRLAAHDFMDYDQGDSRNPMGMDGCLDWTASNNLGLNTIWNDHTDLHQLWKSKYSDISIPDFWVASANAVVRITSDGALDMRRTYYWGRSKADSCEGSADRLPSSSSCREVEGTFLERMGLKWNDAVALLGGHTLGQGHPEFSGHHGTWMPNHRLATRFNKQYYEELFRRAWSPRNVGTNVEDWSSTPTGSTDPKMMLNTDICLLYDVEDGANRNCCTRTDAFRPDGTSRCPSFPNRECATIDPNSNHPRAEAAAAVRRYLGGMTVNDNQQPFYDAFSQAWFKATTNGFSDLKSVRDTC